jgi:hypothetical protein
MDLSQLGALLTGCGALMVGIASLLRVRYERDKKAEEEA